PAPQPPPTPPHGSVVKNKPILDTPTNSAFQSLPGLSPDQPPIPSNHPNAALDTLMPHDIESILIKSPPLDSATSPGGSGDPLKTTSYFPDMGSVGSSSPFNSFTI